MSEDCRKTSPCVALCSGEGLKEKPLLNAGLLAG